MLARSRRSGRRGGGGGGGENHETNGGSADHHRRGHHRRDHWGGDGLLTRTWNRARHRPSASSSSSSSSSSSLPVHAAPPLTCNDFLLGGSYYPGKDKRRAVHVRNRRRRSLCYRACFSSARRTTAFVCACLYLLVGKGLLGSYRRRSTTVSTTTTDDRGPGRPGSTTTTEEDVLAASATSRLVRLSEAERRARRPPLRLDASDLDAVRRMLPEWARRNDVEGAPKTTTTTTTAKTTPKRSAAPPLRTLATMDTSGKCPPLSNNEEEASVSLVVQCTPDRLWLLRETCRRWSDDPIVVVLYVDSVPPPDDVGARVDDLRSRCPHITVITKGPTDGVPTPPSRYPVNALRNVGLDAVTTTHVLVLDVDFLPSATLADAIREHLGDVRSDDEALVVPAFQSNGAPGKQTASDAPADLDQLRQRVAAGDCSVFQSDINPDGHRDTRSARWLRGEWYEGEDDRHLTPVRIPCLTSPRYEPYVVLRADCPHRTPYYDERFVGYGKNKIQFTTHLLFVGYSFRVLPEGFVVHVPHETSDAKREWERTDATVHRDADALYQTFVRELVARHGRPKATPLCPRPRATPTTRSDDHPRATTTHARTGVVQ